ncbi:MAG: metallophosphoesterase, partial [Acidobacteriaceae bacterium]
MLLWVPLPSLGAAQAAQSNAREHVTRAAHGSTIPALFVSDIHINPFRDPAKVPQLVNAPVSRWNAILSTPASPDQEQAFAKLQQSCHTRTIDTSYGLFRSTLQAMQTRQSHPKFITVSGDLVVHDFPCLYSAVFPNAAAGDQEKFVLKTIHFVVNELRTSFPGTRVYVALGNHDTPCGHDAIDARTPFLAQLGRILAAGLPPSAQIKEFAENGSYSVMMPSPMRNTRLISVN